MKKTIKKLWLEALRSGNFEQTTGSLLKVYNGRVSHTEERRCYCCLGVLTELYRKKECTFDWELKRAGGDVDNTDVGYFDGGSDFLPKRVMEWAGLNEEDPNVTAQDTVSEVNDSGESFETIATMIEQNFSEEEQ
jgi:hypothetical protein